jgi:hypothetical protein
MMKIRLSPSEVTALLHTKLDALLAECDQVSENAAYGQTLDDLDTFFLTKGRKFLQETFEAKLQERIDQTEATTEAKQCPDCKEKTHYQDRRSKTIVSAHGHVTAFRRYRYCKPCDSYSFPVEASLGLSTGYTINAKRLATRCCGFWSYRLAAESLAELCGIHLCHRIVGEIVQKVAPELAVKMENNTAIREEFQKAKGETEFYTDGAFIHTRNEEGKPEWCEVKVGAYAKRECGESATPEEWATRDLPEPTVVSAFAAIEEKPKFQERCQKERRRLGIGGVKSALGDGAKWIWSLIFFLFGKTMECLDIYHAAEHLSDCGKVLFGAGEVSKEWFERMRLVLLSEGFAGIERELLLVLEGLTKGQKKKRKAVNNLLKYFRRNKGRMNYRERLAEGRAIGSGLIEGACKNLVGRRLKQTGACWRKPRANRMAIICAALYSSQWKHCWKNPN